MNVLLDTNVVLDVLLARQPWLGDSQSIWQACDDGRITGFLLASTLTDIYYIARRYKGMAAARQAIETCLATFEITPLDRLILQEAFAMNSADFEDDVQLAAAIHSQLDAVVTRNHRDFSNTSLPVLTPPELLAQLESI